jgi:hypothetical protein
MECLFFTAFGQRGLWTCLDLFCMAFFLLCFESGISTCCSSLIFLIFSVHFQTHMGLVFFILVYFLLRFEICIAGRTGKMDSQIRRLYLNFDISFLHIVSLP